MRLFAIVLLFARHASTLPSFRTAEKEYPQLKDCGYGSSPPQMFARMTLQRTRTLIVDWIRPNCAIGGQEVRVDIFLSEYNDGQLGLADPNFCKQTPTCQENFIDPLLRHNLTNTWTAFFYLLHPGLYHFYHKPEGEGYWNYQATVKLLPPMPRTCAQTRNASSNYSFTHCEMPKEFDDNPMGMMDFFDGFQNIDTPKESFCAFDCEECLYFGGSCVCHGNPDNEMMDACPSCNSGSCNTTDYCDRCLCDNDPPDFDRCAPLRAEEQTVPV